MADVLGGGSYTWAVPIVVTDEPDAMFRISAFSSLSPEPGSVISRDISDGVFTIQSSP